jgi:FkbM family methyltransferase
MNGEIKKTHPQVFRDGRGLEIFHYNKAETKFVYREIFEDRIYLRHGITLAKGDCVWDIGANIGLFTIFLQENFEEICVHAFEPCPPIYEILKANTERYGGRAVAHSCGIAGKEGESMFTFYLSYSILSGFHAHEQRDARTLRAGILDTWRRRNAPEQEDRHLEGLVAAALAQKQDYLCHLRTISQMIEETRIPEIALLKIDAEGSELDILSGIRDEHWPLIRQIVMEVHAGEEEGVAPITKILESRGFQATFEEQAGFSASGIVNCYAIRSRGLPR